MASSRVEIVEIVDMPAIMGIWIRLDNRDSGEVLELSNCESHAATCMRHIFIGCKFWLGFS